MVAGIRRKKVALWDRTKETLHARRKGSTGKMLFSHWEEKTLILAQGEVLVGSQNESCMMHAVGDGEKQGASRKPWDEHGQKRELENSGFLLLQNCLWLQ